MEKDLSYLVGKTVELISMDDPYPVESGTKGVVYHIGFDVIDVKWENGRTLGLIDGFDKYRVIN